MVVCKSYFKSRIQAKSKQTGSVADISWLIATARSRDSVLTGQHVRPLLALKPQQYVPPELFIELHKSGSTWRDLSLASVCSSTFASLHSHLVFGLPESARSILVKFRRVNSSAPRLVTLYASIWGKVDHTLKSIRWFMFHSTLVLSFVNHYHNCTSSLVVYFWRPINSVHTNYFEHSFATVIGLQYLSDNYWSFTCT